MISLPTLLDLTHYSARPLFDDAHTVCRAATAERNKDYRWADFCARRDAWARVFSEQQGRRIALFSHSTFDFICALSALWQCQKVAVIAGANDQKTCEQLRQHCDAFAGDFPLCKSLKAADSSLPQAHNSGDNNYSHCNNKSCDHKPQPSDLAAVIFTSGSSGSPLPIHKSFAQLDAELTALETLWGDTVKHCTITGTVSHQHIYGLLFRLLWPVLAGRPFVDCARDYSESLLSDGQRYKKIAAIMSPAHLSRLPQTLSCQALRQQCLAVFSSGAPLSEKAATETHNILQLDAIEVYGSSETGGVAYRQQRQNPLWQPLPAVSIKAASDSGVLCVKSPHLENANWFTTADTLDTFSEAGFTLGKRVDRIAKIGGKRISLTDIERNIQQHPLVDQVRVVALDKRGGRSAALVVLNAEGNNQLINCGKRHINTQLSESLHNKVERIALPRYWRYWDSIPCNQQGKTTQAELESFFDDTNKPKFPELLNSTNSAEHSFSLELFVPHNLSWFDGHFPGRPILPGVVQTHWANHYGQQVFGQLGRFSHLEMIKFQQVISPGKHLQLQLKWNPEKHKLSFSYLRGEQKLSSGRIAFKVVPHE